MPSPTGTVQQSVISGGSGLAVPVEAENVDLAVEFLTWLYEEDNYLEYLESDKGISFIEGTTVDYDDEKLPQIMKLFKMKWLTLRIIL